MIDYQMTIDRTNILSLTSTRADRICLPYESNDVYFHVGAMISDYIGTARSYLDTEAGDRQLSKDVTAILNGSSIAAALILLPYRREPLAGIEITVDLPDGEHLTRKISGTVERETVEAILDRFFDVGAAGMSSTYRAHWEKLYRGYKERKAR